MSEQAIKFYAAKFFPHLLPAHGVACIKALLRAEGKTRRP
jgi:hypothetical protein